MDKTLFNSTCKEDIEFCLKRGDNINGLDMITNETPFIHHCANGNSDAVLTLIENGCDVKHRQYGSKNGLDFICEKGHSTLLNLVLKFSHIRELININKRLISPLAIACMYGNCDIFDILIENGANVNHVNIGDMSIIDIAITYNKPFLLRKLLDCGADIFFINKRKESYLHSTDLKIECLDILLCYGCLIYINHQDFHGRTPLLKNLEVPIEQVNISVVRRLIDCGADINICDKQFRTPLGIAQARRHHEIVQLLTSKK